MLMVDDLVGTGDVEAVNVAVEVINVEEVAVELVEAVNVLVRRVEILVVLLDAWLDALYDGPATLVMFGFAMPVDD